MAQFYASIQGNRGEGTRMGSKSSGMESHTRGWNLGVRVEMQYDEKNKRDIAFVYITGGSNHTSSIKKLLTLTEEDVEICSR